LRAIPNLHDIMLFNNNLGGAISGFSKHQGLAMIDVANNNIGGEVPDDYPTSLTNLLYLHGQSNSLHGFLPFGFSTTNILDFDFTDNAFYCPIPELPPGGRATCGSCSISSADPDHCVLGGNCVVSIIGQGFVVGQKAFCLFGDITEVKATVVSDTELTCVIIPSKAGSCDLSISVYGLPATSNSIPFSFVESDKQAKYLPLPAMEKKVPANPSAEPVHIRIHGMSKDAELGKIMKFFDGIYTSISIGGSSDVVDIDFGFIMRPLPYYALGYWAPNGQSEVIGNAMILCVKEMTNVSTAMKFSACLSQNADIFLPTPQHVQASWVLTSMPFVDVLSLMMANSIWATLLV